MRKFTLFAFVSLFLTVASDLAAQKTTKQAAPLQRCGTMEAIEKRLQEDPVYRAQWEAAQKTQATSNQRANVMARGAALTGPVTIPVIVHVVLPNPTVITEEQIDYLLNQLNACFSGLNSDSANGAGFAAVRGHSLLRFTRARRDPSGNLSNGIERKVGAVQIAGNTYQPIKHASAGGLDPWDVTKYYNIWVGDGGPSGLLGIAPTIGVGGQTETTSSNVGIDGVCIDYRGFSNGCFSIPAFNQAKTVVHEVGHNFGLYHIWGDANCGVDFKQLATAPAQALPDALNAPSDDTPSQTGPTSGCPAIGTLNGCTPSGPKMFQNYMDYTNDPCYSMFTKGQVARMEYVLENFRAGYLTTNGAVPPSNVPALDIAPTTVVSPGGSEFDPALCRINNYPTPNCAGNFVPRVSVTNNGSSTITTLTATVQVNGGAIVPVTLTGLNLLTGRSITVVFPAQAAVQGSNTVIFKTSAPNGGADGVTSNDALTTTFTVAAPIPIPVSQDFENASLAPWTVVNPNGDFTWVRKAPGRNSATALFIDNWTTDATGNIDDFRSAPLAVNPSDSLIINFDLAHKYYPDPLGYDTLQVLISSDCGATFTEVYKKWGPGLATAGSMTGNYTNPIASDWRSERIGLGGNQLSGGKIIIVFRNKTRWGNNIFIDNINIAKKASRDLKLETILSPGASICSPNVTPQVTVSNVGEEAVTSFKVGYRIGTTGNFTTQTFTQTLAPNATATLTLAGFTSPAAGGTITAFVGDPVGATGTGDQQNFNDTLRSNFILRTVVNSPIIEGFEGTFPPANWTIADLNGDGRTWAKRAPGRNSGFSAFMDNYSNPDVTGFIDEMRLPALNIAGRDSVIVSFDVAHKNFTGFPDVLSVRSSLDCGNTFSVIYSKSGATLATAGASNAAFTAPTAANWRRERVALGGSQIASNSLILYFRNLSGWGNNIFIDNVNIEALSKRDLQLVSINSLPAYQCTQSFTPSVVVKNIGIEIVTGFKVAYAVDGGAMVTTTVNSLNLKRDSSISVTLNSGNVSGAGAHTLKAFSFEPITASGTGDQAPQNDTLTAPLNLSGTQALPLSQNFVTAAFPPANWLVTNPDNGRTWQYSTVGNGNTGSAFLNTFTYAGSNNVDQLVSPVLTYSGVDSINLSFDVASVSRVYPGSTAVPLDTLEVLVSTNCGNSFQTVYKKWGQELQTTSPVNGDPNFPSDQAFVPNNGSQWRTETVSLSNYVSNPSLQVVFRATSNNGNNIYLDNVNVTSRVLPAQLKQAGYLFLPNPFTSSFNIWHYQTPTTLKYVTVYDSKGQLVWRRSFSKNAEKLISVDLSGQPAGVYMVNIGYEDEYRNVSERVIKR